MTDTEFDIKRRRLLRGTVSACAAGFLPWSLTRAQLAQAEDAPNGLTISYMADVPTWDPTAVTATQMQSIYESVYDSPLRMSTDGQLEARQLTSWSWQDKHATRLAVTLRDKLVFHDGSPLTTVDLKWSLLERPAIDKKLAIHGLMNTLIDVEIVSPTRAVLVFNAATPAAPVSLAFLTAYILPKAYMQKVGDAFLSKPIGAGPYKVVDYQRNSRIVLEAFDQFWAGPPPIKRVTFQIAPDPSTRVAALESGASGMAVQIPIREVQRLAKNKSLTTSITPYSEIYMVRIPSYVKPFDDDNVRAAMHYAIDTHTLSKAFYAGVAPPISVFATPGSPSDVPGFTFPFDPQRAIAALAKSGYSTAKPVKITLLTTNGTFPSDYDMARAIAAMWQRVGIQASVMTVSPAEVVSQIHAGKMSGALLQTWANSSADPDNYAGRIFDPRLQFSAWKDAALGPRIGAIMSEVDTDKRMAGYRALNQEASEKSWAIPLLQAVSAIAYQKTLAIKTYASGYILPSEFLLR